MQVRMQVGHPGVGAAGRHGHRPLGQGDGLGHLPSRVGGDGQGLEGQTQGEVVPQPRRLRPRPPRLGLGRLRLSQEEPEVGGQSAGPEPLGLGHAGDQRGGLELADRRLEAPPGPEDLSEGSAQGELDASPGPPAEDVAGELLRVLGPAHLEQEGGQLGGDGIVGVPRTVELQGPLVELDRRRR